MGCFSPLKGWKSLNNGGLTFDRSEASEKMDVSCGQCLGCRVDRSCGWAMRIVHESSLYEFDNGNCFVTLTYRSPEECTEEQRKNGYYVPSDFSLHESHVQKFLKRLRKAYPDQKIRYYYCGEYGSICKHGFDCEVYKHDCKTGRPHYHLCLFNFRPSDGEAIGPELFGSAELDKLWKYGYTSYGDLTFQSAAYVAGYVLKKVTGNQEAEKYLVFDEEAGHDIWLTPEFARMSLKPGIGHDWLEKFKRDVFPHDNVPVPGVGVKELVPRYYMQWLSKTDPLMFEEVKAKRLEWLSENKEEFTPDRLMAKYKVTKANRALFNPRNTL